ncbi:MAG: zinc-dependent alcohol dehydrogenase [Acidimicrobiales bacterium]
MKALVFERSLPRYAAARVAGSIVPGSGARVGPLSLLDVEEPSVDRVGWHRVWPRLAGICGSDLATVDGRSSRYFEPIVSFPFVPGHEVVGDLDDGSRVVVEPILACAARGVEPPCEPCRAGNHQACERIAFGHLRPGLQTGYCTDTGGGWGLSLVAHQTQLHVVPEAMSDEAAVMVEPAACATHAALAAADGVSAGDRSTVVVLGAGTLGLCTIAAVRRFLLPGTLLVTAKHPDQRRLALELGADVVAEPDELRRAVRRSTRSLTLGEAPGEVLTAGAEVVIDCIGSAESITDALAVARPGGEVVLVGMPGPLHLDLTPLWHREIRLRGAYAYGAERDGRRTFDLAFELVENAGLERLVSARYSLERFRDAIEHAAHAGRRGAVKVVFDLRQERGRRPGKRP